MSEQTPETLTEEAKAVSSKLNEVLKQQSLLDVEEQPKVETDYNSQLKDLVRRVKMANRDYAAAISLFERAGKIDEEVLNFVAKHLKEGKELKKKLSIVEVSRLLSNKDKKFNYTIDLAPIGITGTLELKKLNGKFTYSKIWDSELKLKKEIKIKVEGRKSKKFLKSKTRKVTV